MQLSTVLTRCGGKRERPLTNKPPPVVPSVWTGREVKRFQVDSGIEMAGEREPLDRSNSPAGGRSSIVLG